MIKGNTLKALNDQVNAEYYSAYLYLAMSAYADRAGFKGVANWLFVQAQEEMAHATHIYQHILERGGTPAFSDIKAPGASYGSVKEVFEKVLTHERFVTGLIDKIASVALGENDHATYNFIMWYVNEQVEEEANADEILSKLNFIGDNNGLLYNLDSTLAARVFTDPFAAAAQNQQP
ncbi:MAG: ferritin [Synergistaceae bacterium]|nr:ferritin [Synergistaceae bacterium]